MNLYLDDLRDCPEGFALARNIEECISLLKTNHVHILSLDHDLGMDAGGNLLPTGYDLVKWICEFHEEYQLSIERVHLHTDNNVGRDNMYHTLPVSYTHLTLPTITAV